MAMFDDAVAEFRIEDFRQLIGDGFIFGVDELCGKNAGEESRETIKLHGELIKLLLGNVPEPKA
jgi:hypothetical protein